VRVLTRRLRVHLGKGLAVAGRENLFERDAFALKELALPSDFTFLEFRVQGLGLGFRV